MEKNDKNIETNNNEVTVLDRLKKAFHRELPKFTAEFAWIETTYGSGSYRTLEERVKDKQQSIIRTIRSKFPAHNDGHRISNSNGSYRCVVDIEEDLACCVNQIFKPFIDGGFKIINLSKQIEEIEDENVYLISWKKVFMKDKDNNI